MKAAIIFTIILLQYRYFKLEPNISLNISSINLPSLFCKISDETARNLTITSNAYLTFLPITKYCATHFKSAIIYLPISNYCLVITDWSWWIVQIPPTQIRKRPKMYRNVHIFVSDAWKINAITQPRQSFSLHLKLVHFSLKPFEKSTHLSHKYYKWCGVQFSTSLQPFPANYLLQWGYWHQNAWSFKLSPKQ